MKSKPKFKIIGILLFAVIFIMSACTKENEEVKVAPALSTSQVYNITGSSATVVGFVVAQGSGFTERGVVYSTTPAPTIAKSKLVYSGDVTWATFTVNLSGLNYNTKYYVRAYATNSDGTTLYGEEFSFTTTPLVPQLTTTDVTVITGNSASSGGNITLDGGAAVTARGIVYAIHHAPTTDDSKTSNGTGTGVFTSAMTGLTGNTTYYVRAYATNSAGTGYGPEVYFTTLVDLPGVRTDSLRGVTKVAATAYNTVFYNGGGTVTARGIVWGTNPNPTISGNKIAGGSGTGSFVSNLTGLTSNTDYHLRAYATNSAGTAYGADVAFKTLADIMIWYVPGDYVAASYPGSAFADWSPGSSPQVKSTVTNSSKLEGYVYMANASNNWKFASQPNWNGPNYGSGGTGLLSASGGNITTPAGYYKLNADATALTYTAVATVWGVIGDATPGGWGDETGLSYYPALTTWRGGIHMTIGAFKFRANHSWDYNYGSTDHVNLVAGGDNIPITLIADYYVILDLSHPQAYTYSANTWGVIGDATPGGWSSDTNMTWDATNKVMKVTMNLTAGSFKFRANDDWGINLGGSLTALTYGGGNISVATAGNYTITLDLGKVVPVATMTLN